MSLNELIFFFKVPYSSFVLTVCQKVKTIVMQDLISKHFIVFFHFFLKKTLVKSYISQICARGMLITLKMQLDIPSVLVI